MKNTSFERDKFTEIKKKYIIKTSVIVYLVTPASNGIKYNVHTCTLVDGIFRMMGF